MLALGTYPSFPPNTLLLNGSNTDLFGHIKYYGVWYSLRVAVKTKRRVHARPLFCSASAQATIAHQRIYLIGRATISITYHMKTL